ncbi:MAG: transcription elongation factor GreA [Chloroflexi bacterium]|nr:transcription elongation factor GreA [Chloroflexota bacterium]
MNEQTQSGTASDLTLGRAITSYLADLIPEDREVVAPELHRLMRWLGADRRLEAVTPTELERYQHQLEDSGIDPTVRLGPVRDFFGYAKRKKLTASNLGTHIRVRRKTGAQRAARGGRGQTKELRIEVTREGYDQLQRELDRLEHDLAPKVRADLQSAYADKDFRENAPYEAAKQRLGEIQGKINELKATLSVAMIVQAPGRTDRVTLGSTVTVRDLADDEELTYTLVGPGEVDARRGRISIASPVGKALTDRTPGETVVVQTPAGPASYRIERITKA